jgi:hypothetical protein
MILANTARIVGRVVSAPDSVLASGQAGMNAHQLSGYGDFLFIQGTEAQRFIAAQADDELKSLPEPASPLLLDDGDDAVEDVGSEWYDVGRLVAESRNRTISVPVVKDILGVGGTKKAQRLRDETFAVLRGIADGGAMVQDG